MNGATDWASVKRLFLDALDLREGDREAWLAAQCADDHVMLAEVRSLLVAHGDARGDLLSRGGVKLASAIAASLATEQIASPPTRIGPYAILREIGSGGMGRVFLARREDGQYERQVALKLIRDELAHPELLRRFLRERDTLARLLHPNIAALLDGGIEGKAPYFTMEFVEGDPIDVWCDAQRLDIRGRVALVVSICGAIQHAHRNLVVHRDIKPSNIFVARDGAPKLLDFGIAKPLDDLGAGEKTGTTLHPMTREYAAPEQILGEPITIATDEYALGVLLYRLLTGHLPYPSAERGDIGWPKAIVEESPQPLDRAFARASAQDALRHAELRGVSAEKLRRALRGDLDRIVQRALAKSPEARYPTVGALADDLRAFLDGRALSGDTRWYRVRKFARRHRLPLAAAAIAVLALLAGTAGIAWESHQRRIAAESALHEAQASAAVKDFVVGLFENANPNATEGKVRTLRDAVDLGMRRLDRIPENQPALRAELQLTLAQIYFELDQYQLDATLSSQAFEALKSRPDDAVLAARAERFESTALASLGDRAKAQMFADDAVVRLRAAPHASRSELARTLYNASWVALTRSDLDRVKRYADEAQALASEAPVDDAILYKALQMKGDWARRTHDFPLAVASYRQALALSANVNGPNDEESVTIGHSLALSLEELGQYDDALAVLQHALAIANRLFGEAGSRTVRLGEVAGVTEFESGRLVDARDRFARLVALTEARVPVDESLLAEVRLNYGELSRDLGDSAEAEKVLVEVRDFLFAHEGSDPSETVETLAALAAVETDSGKLESAEAELRQAQSLLIAAKRPGDAIVEARMSRIRQLEGDNVAAIDLARGARDVALKTDGERSYDTAEVHYIYGLALATGGHPREAEDEWRAALASYRQLLPPDGMHLQSADVRLALGEQLARDSDDRDEALRLLHQGIALRERFFGPDDARAKTAASLVADLEAGRAERSSVSSESR